MIDLTQTYREFRGVLAPLGVEVGPEVLALWLDRERHGSEPLPAGAVKQLAEMAFRLFTVEPL